MKNKIRKFKAGIMLIRAIVLNKLYGKRTPLWANLFITNRCNLNCLYCFVDVNNKTVEDFSLEQIFKMVDELKELGTIVVCLLGGEPLLRKDLNGIVDYIHSKGMLSEINTNGIKIDQHIDTLKKVDSVCISIDGDEYHHDLNRGKGSYKTALAAIECASVNNLHLRIHSTVTKNNTPSLDHVVKLARQFNVKLNCAIAAIPSGVNNDALKFSNEEIRDFYKKIMEYKKNGYPISNAGSTLKYLINWPYSFDFLADNEMSVPCDVKTFPCKRKAFTCYVDADGMMYPCATIWKKKKVGNVLDVGVERAWELVETLDCTFCITEVEVNMLFNAKPSSLWNVFSYMVTDPLRRKNIKIK